MSERERYDIDLELIRLREKKRKPLAELVQVL